MPFEKERDVAIEAALKAGAFIRSHAGRLENGVVREKGTHDLVTFVDEESDRLILEDLRAAFPSYDVLSEEGTGVGDADPVADGYRWIVDPVDGTTNFTHNQPPFSVSIGLQCEDRLVVGVVLEVGHNELFVATRGGGLSVNGRRVTTSSARTLGESLLTTGFPFKEFSHIDPYLRVLRTAMMNAQALRRPGSAAADFSYVAVGRMDGFFEIGLSPWDVAAGALLVEEGGGTVSDMFGGDDYLFSGHMLASNGHIHDELVKLVEPLAESVRERA